MLKVEGLTRRYGDQTVVDNLSFNVNEGEFVALLGPSGCGKSTSLKMIAGLVTPDAGSIELEGKDITHLTPGQRKLAMVFQSYALFPHLKVVDNILFGLRKTNNNDASIRWLNWWDYRSTCKRNPGSFPVGKVSESPWQEPLSLRPSFA